MAVKSAEKQGRAVAFRTHQCFVRQRTQLINALRGHPAEFGLVAPKGPIHLKLLHTALKGSEVVHHVFKTTLWRSAMKLDTDDMLRPVSIQ